LTKKIFNATTQMVLSLSYWTTGLNGPRGSCTQKESRSMS